MALLSDVSVNAMGDDPKKQVESIVRQINENNRLISNEDFVQIYKDQTGTNRYISGLLSDGTIGTKVSKPDIDVNGASDTELIRKDDFSTTTYYDDDNSRILIGKLPDGSYGLVISKEGVNVEDVFD